MLIAVHLLIAAHIAHWLIAGTTVTPVEPSEAMAFSKGGMVNAGLIFFAAAILLTAVFGRYFCGWACHLVALQDLCRWLLEKVGIRPVPLRSRLLLWVPAIAFVYMFLWPAIYRLWIGDRFDRFGVELTTSHFWETFPGWVIGGLTFLVCGFASVYFLGAKGFCTYACPYGAIFAAADRVAPMRIRVTDACEGCGHCTAVCTSNVRVHEEVRDYGMVVDPGCMKCRDCVSVCPNDALYYGAGPISLFAKPRVEEPAVRKPALSWKHEGVLALAFAACFFTFRGLYGVVPFLMSLGLAAVVAYAVLVAVEMATRENVARRRWGLKRGGRLLPAGWAFLGLLAVFGLFWAHSAYLRWHGFLGERAYREMVPLVRGALDVAEEPRVLSAEERALAERARDHLETVRAAGLFPTAGNAARLAWTHAVLGDSEALRRSAVDALGRGEQTAQMHRLVAADAWRRGDVEVAVAAYGQAIATEPDSPEPYESLGIVLARSGELAAAREVFDRGLRAAPGSARLAYNAGLARALMGDSEGAIAHFERALELDPRHLEARENLAGMLAQIGRFEESVEHFARALEQAPGDAGTRLLRARALAELGRLAEARAEARKALETDPALGEARRLLADLTARPSSTPRRSTGRETQANKDGARR